MRKDCAGGCEEQHSCRQLPSRKTAVSLCTEWGLQRGLWGWQFPLISANINSSPVCLRPGIMLLGPKIRYVEMLSTTVFVSCCRWVLKEQKVCSPPPPLAVCRLGTVWHRPLAAGQTRKDLSPKEKTVYSETLLVSKHSPWASRHPKRGLFNLFHLL